MNIADSLLLTIFSKIFFKEIVSVSYIVPFM